MSCSSQYVRIFASSMFPFASVIHVGWNFGWRNSRSRPRTCPKARSTSLRLKRSSSRNQLPNCTVACVWSVTRAWSVPVNAQLVNEALSNVMRTNAGCVLSSRKLNLTLAYFAHSFAASLTKACEAAEPSRNLTVRPFFYDLFRPNFRTVCDTARCRRRIVRQCVAVKVGHALCRLSVRAVGRNIVLRATGQYESDGCQ